MLRPQVRQRGSYTQYRERPYELSSLTLACLSSLPRRDRSAVPAKLKSGWMGMFLKRMQ
jgi:hypothetical protein